MFPFSEWKRPRREVSAVHSTSKPIAHSFKAEPEDHCETPGGAYDDITHALCWLSEKIGKSPSDLCIYDPYFCDGAVVRNLAARGFLNVYNRNEDFYATVAANRTPTYDVVVSRVLAK